MRKIIRKYVEEFSSGDISLIITYFPERNNSLPGNVS